MSGNSGREVMFEITDEMIERLARHMYERLSLTSGPDDPTLQIWDDLSTKCLSAWRERARDALEVARGGAGAV